MYRTIYKKLNIIINIIKKLFYFIKFFIFLLFHSNINCKRSSLLSITCNRRSKFFVSWFPVVNWVGKLRNKIFKNLFEFLLNVNFSIETCFINTAVMGMRIVKLIVSKSSFEEVDEMFRFRAEVNL